MHRLPPSCDLPPHPLPSRTPQRRPRQAGTVRDAADLHDSCTRAWADHLDAGRIGTRVPPQPGVREAAERTAALFRRLAGRAR